jgi:hypothetical protein
VGGVSRLFRATLSGQAFSRRPCVTDVTAAVTAEVTAFNDTKKENKTTKSTTICHGPTAL